MVKVVLIILISILFITNLYFFTKFVKLQELIRELTDEYNSFLTKGDDLKLQLSKLSTLTNSFNKIKSQSRRSVVDFITAKSQDLQIPFVQYSEKDEKIEKAQEGQKAKKYEFKTFQFIYNGIEISKLISLLVICEQELPGIRVKVIDLSMKDKKIVERVTIEFIRIISIDSIKN